MLNKIFLLLLLIAVSVMSFFTYYPFSWLHSIGSPEIAVENFNYYSNLGWSFLWISIIVLVVFANIVLFKTGKSLTIWLAYVYFAVFMVLQTIWLAPAFLAFMKANSLAESTFSFTPMIGVITIIILAFVVFFSRFIVLRLREKLSVDDAEEITDTE